jgi:hypothetical protein
MSPSAVSLSELAAPRYVLRWARPMPRPRGPEVAIRRGLDLVAPDRPGTGPVARIPVKRPALLRYRYQRDQAGFVDGFGAGVHSVMTSVDDEWVPLAHFVRHGQPERSEPGFKYRLEDAEHEELALIESARSLNLAAGAPHWTCTAADGTVVEARPHLPADRQVRQLPDRLRRAVRRRPSSTEPGVWAGNPVNGRGGWDLLDADRKTIAWLTPPATAYSTSFAVVGPDGASLEELDPAVLLFGYFVLFGELQRHGGKALQISSD